MGEAVQQEYNEELGWGMTNAGYEYIEAADAKERLKRKASIFSAE